MGLRLEVGTAVEQHVIVFRGRHQNRQGGPVDPRQRAQLQLAGGQQRPGVAGRDNRVRLALFDELNGPAHRAVFLASHRLDRRIVHLDHLGGVNDLDLGRDGSVALELGVHPCAVADQVEFGDRAVVAQGLDGSGNDVLGRVIAPHRIDGNLHRDRKTRRR